MILCLGEILVDNINGKMYPGGAPFNVANQIKKLNGDVAFLGSVGNDIAGEFLLSFSESQFKGHSYLEKLEKATTQAFVKIDEDKERHFSFFRNNTADSFINIEKLKELSKTSSLIHIGSLILSNEETKSSLISIIKELKKQNKIISFDLNYRDDIFKDINVLKDFIQYVDILKLSLDELELLTNKKIKSINSLKNTMKEISLDNQLILVTLGKDGSCYYQNDKFNIIKSIKVECIDTTGAGDSFFGAFLFKYYDVIQLIDKNQINLDEILEFANLIAAHSTTKIGAIDSQITIDEYTKIKEEKCN